MMKPEWIEMKEGCKLPPNGDTVDLTVLNGNVKHGMDAQYTPETGWTAYGDPIGLIQILAWRPIYNEPKHTGLFNRLMKLYEGWL